MSTRCKNTPVSLRTRARGNILGRKHGHLCTRTDPPAAGYSVTAGRREKHLAAPFIGPILTTRAAPLYAIGGNLPLQAPGWKAVEHTLASAVGGPCISPKTIEATGALPLWQYVFYLVMSSTSVDSQCFLERYANTKFEKTACWTVPRF